MWLDVMMVDQDLGPPDEPDEDYMVFCSHSGTVEEECDQPAFAWVSERFMDPGKPVPVWAYRTLCSEHLREVHKAFGGAMTHYNPTVSRVHMEACSCGVDFGQTCRRSDGQDRGWWGPHTMRIFRAGVSVEEYRRHMESE